MLNVSHRSWKFMTSLALLGRAGCLTYRIAHLHFTQAIKGTSCKIAPKRLAYAIKDLKYKLQSYQALASKVRYELHIYQALA